MNRVASVALAVAITGCSATASAQQPASGTGNAWYADCTAGIPTRDALCTGFVIGLLNGVRIQAAVDNKKPGFCAPANATYGQYQDVFVNFLRDNPAKRHEWAPGLFYEAMLAAFPCKP